ncbi:hypothetical protein U8P68_11705 [Rhizobium ruizarguesonis]|nr:hypothetical protein U8P68_11705 [Rhizobium ruizarguesonis]
MAAQGADEAAFGKWRQGSRRSLGLIGTKLLPPSCGGGSQAAGALGEMISLISHGRPSRRSRRGCRGRNKRGLPAGTGTNNVLLDTSIIDQGE